MFVLLFADFRGFSQFGVTAGVGILLALAATLLLQPALVVMLARWRLISPSLDHAVPGNDTAKPSPLSRPRATVVLGVCLAAGLIAAALLPRVTFEYRMGELEPRFEEYERLREKEGRVYPATKRNPAYVLVDDPVEMAEVVDSLRTRAVRDTTSPTILSVESLQERYPESAEMQSERLADIAEIRDLLSDPFLRVLGGQELRRLETAAQTVMPVAIDSVPDFLKSRFMSRSGEIGSFVVVYPSVGLSDGRMSMAFADDVGQVTTSSGTTYQAASTSLVAADMMRLLVEESRVMVAMTGGVLLIILFFAFRSVKYTLLAALPLILGMLWMMGLMGVMDIRTNFYNLIVLPAVLGIGVDGGVHVVHRYRQEGPGSVWHVLRSSGEHVLAGSVTTLIAFAWWLRSFHPGLNSIGQLAVIGIFAVLVASLVALPALLRVLEGRSKGDR